MRPRKMVLVTAPGLPPWPRLYLDQQRRLAYVVAKHPTWRSYEWALRATTFLKWVVFVPTGYCLWLQLFQLDTSVRIVALFLGCCFLFPIVSLTIRYSTHGFLARQLFATRTKFWASPHAIAFQSRFYRKPVVVWRRWKDQRVKSKFILNRDADAASCSMDRQGTQNHPRGHLNEAMVLEIVVTAVDTRTTVASRDQLLQRTIPITEVDGQLARKFTMVFAAAVMLTSNDSQVSALTTSGTDIDH